MKTQPSAGLPKINGDASPLGFYHGFHLQAGQLGHVCSCFQVTHGLGVVVPPVKQLEMIQVGLRLGKGVHGRDVGKINENRKKCPVVQG